MSAVALLPSSSLVTVSIDSFLFGNFFVLACAAFYLFMQREWQYGIQVNMASLLSQPMNIASIVVTICAAAHWILVVYRSFMAFMYAPVPLGRVEYIANLGCPSEVIKTAVAVVVLIVFDAVMIYRLWIIWDRKIIPIIFPCGCLLGEITGSIGTIYEFAHYKLGTQDVFSSSLGRWISTSTTLTLPINIFCASLIAWKLWRAHVRIRDQHSPIFHILIILVESAALYVAWSIGFVVAYQSQSNVQFFFIDSWTSIAGIAFMLINVRVGLGKSRSNSSVSSCVLTTFQFGGHDRTVFRSSGRETRMSVTSET